MPGPAACGGSLGVLPEPGHGPAQPGSARSHRQEVAAPAPLSHVGADAQRRGGAGRGLGCEADKDSRGGGREAGEEKGGRRRRRRREKGCKIHQELREGGRKQLPLPFSDRKNRRRGGRSEALPGEGGQGGASHGRPMGGHGVALPGVALRPPAPKSPLENPPCLLWGSGGGKREPRLGGEPPKGRCVPLFTATEA